MLFIVVTVVCVASGYLTAVGAVPPHFGLPCVAIAGAFFGVRWLSLGLPREGATSRNKTELLSILVGAALVALGGHGFLVEVTLNIHVFDKSICLLFLFIGVSIELTGRSYYANRRAGLSDSEILWWSSVVVRILKYAGLLVLLPVVVVGMLAASHCLGVIEVQDRVWELLRLNRLLVAVITLPMSMVYFVEFFVHPEVAASFAVLESQRQLQAEEKM